MEFFNRKEEVVDIQLTQYGKYLLSRGVLQPSFYAFFDDDIIYDSQYMSTGSSDALEASTQTAERIKTTPRIKTQYVFEGVDRTHTQISKVNTSFNSILGKTLTLEYTDEQKLEELEKAPSVVDNHYAMSLPLGTSDGNSNKAPAWLMSFLNGVHSGSVNFYTSSSGLVNIPQIEVEVKYDTSVAQINEEIGFNFDLENASSSEIFPDGTYVKIDKDYVLIDLQEANVPFDLKNYDLEVYDFQHETADVTLGLGMKEVLVPLYFSPGEKVYNNIYYTEGMKKEVVIDDNNVEYYVEVRTDEEIDLTKELNAPDVYGQAPNDEEPC
jgi:hypothetical protein